MVISSNKFKNTNTQTIFVWQFYAPSSFSRTLQFGFPINILTTAGSFQPEALSTNMSNSYVINSTTIKVYRSTNILTPTETLFLTIPVTAGTLINTNYSFSVSTTGNKLFTTNQFIGSLDGDFTPTIEYTDFYYNLYVEINFSIESTWNITLLSSNTSNPFSITATFQSSQANVRTSTATAGSTLTFNTANPSTYFYGTGTLDVQSPAVLGTIYGFNMYANGTMYCDTLIGKQITSNNITATGNITANNSLYSPRVYGSGIGVTILNGVPTAGHGFITLSQSRTSLSVTSITTHKADLTTGGFVGTSRTDNFNNLTGSAFIPYGWGIIGYSGQSYGGTIIINAGNNSDLNGFYVTLTTNDTMESCKIFFNGLEQA